MNPDLAVILASAERATHVRLNHERLHACAHHWRDTDFSIPNWRMPVFPEKDGARFINFLGVGNAINFCFTDPETKQKYATEYLGERWEGSFAMWAALKRALDDGMPLLNLRFLASLSIEKHRKIFRGDPPLPLLGKRLDCLRSVAYSWRNNFGSYANLLRTTGYRAFNDGRGFIEKLVGADTQFRDTMHDPVTGTTLHFRKRANLFLMMYHGRALSSKGKLRKIVDADSLLPPADYEIPRALRHLGILEYSPLLARTVDAQHTIEEGSAFEREIRTQTVAAMCELVETLTDLRDDPVTIAALDYKIWREGRSSPKPHHLTETIAY